MSYVFQVSHLETSNSAMAEDLIQKTKIIEHYVRDTGTKNGKDLVIYLNLTKGSPVNY